MPSDLYYKQPKEDKVAMIDVDPTTGAIGLMSMIGALIKSLVGGKPKCDLPKGCPVHMDQAKTIEEIKDRLESGDKHFEEQGRMLKTLGPLVIDMAAEQGVVKPVIKDSLKELFK